MVFSSNEVAVIDRIFSQGNVAKLSDFIIQIEIEPVLKSLLSKKIITRTLLSSIICKRCGEPMEERFNNLFCSKCGEIIELDEKNRNQFSSFSVIEPNLIIELRKDLVKNSLEFEVEKLSIPLPSIHYVGTIRAHKDNSHCDLIISSKPITESILYGLLGFSTREQRFFLIAYSSLSRKLDQEKIAYIAPPNLKLIRFPTIIENEFPKTIQQYLKFTGLLSSQIHSLSETLNERFKLAPTSDEIRFAKQVLALGKIGREQFENVALILLRVLGPTGRLHGRRYKPEGALFLPDGFLIVDAKSSSTFFSFSVDERDKMKRYIDTLENQAHKFGDYKFYGEIILTRSIRDPLKVLSKVEDYFKRNRISGRIIVVTLEGILSLFRQAGRNPEFYYRIDFKEHPLQLFNLQKYELPADSGSSSIGSYKYVTYVNEERFTHFLKYVMSSPIIGLSGRTKENLIQMVSEAYERSF